MIRDVITLILIVVLFALALLWLRASAPDWIVRLPSTTTTAANNASTTRLFRERGLGDVPAHDRWRDDYTRLSRSNRSSGQQSATNGPQVVALPRVPHEYYDKFWIEPVCPGQRGGGAVPQRVYNAFVPGSVPGSSSQAA